MVLGAGTAFAFLRGPANPLDVACFAEANPDSDRVGVHMSGQDPWQVCEQAWADGDLTNPSIPIGTVPELIGCISPAESLWIFPELGGVTCQALGLTPSGPPTVDDPVLELANRLSDYVRSRRCIPFDDSETDVQEILDDLGLDDWTLIVESALGDRPCASIAFDAVNREITLVPATHPDAE